MFFFVKSEVSVTQNHEWNSGLKFRLLIPDWILEKFDFDFWSPGRTLIFCSSFLAWTDRNDLKLEQYSLKLIRVILNFQSVWRHRSKLGFVPVKGTYLKFIFFTKNETSGILRLTRIFRWFHPKLRVTVYYLLLQFNIIHTGRQSTTGNKNQPQRMIKADKSSATDENNHNAVEF
jgi:hypothetical protein